jgi:hypothetical protein
MVRNWRPHVTFVLSCLTQIICISLIFMYDIFVSHVSHVIVMNVAD